MPGYTRHVVVCVLGVEQEVVHVELLGGHLCRLDSFKRHYFREKIEQNILRHFNLKNPCASLITMHGCRNVAKKKTLNIKSRVKSVRAIELAYDLNVTLPVVGDGWKINIATHSYVDRNVTKSKL